MPTIQKIEFPFDCNIINHNFYDYDPLLSFSETTSLQYLSEDLFQCTFPEENIVIDLGWYGDIANNKGEFKLYMIQNENWEIPLKVFQSKSLKEIKSTLLKILEYYSRN
ncbi:hypothetical protein Q4595_15050 [Wenyingzhuangia sp. 1_MG-2023]|nr:hypothetical protein [Wenyingzhuangia sp. 1_MG-2023]